MVKFAYKMQNILDVKSKLEDQAKTNFSAAAARLSQEEERLAELNRRKAWY